MKPLIILTSTVFVTDKIFIDQSDPHERLQSYLKSITDWLNVKNVNLLVVENSGYPFKELGENENLEIISFDEMTLPEANYLKFNNSKGASELFAINYAFNKTRFKNSTSFVIKVTGRYFIPGFDSYLETLNLQDFDAICQNGNNRCEFIGCKPLHFDRLFDISLVLNDGTICNHIEFLYTQRINRFDRLVICKKLPIEPTRRGGDNGYYNFL